MAMQIASARDIFSFYSLFFGLTCTGLVAGCVHVFELPCGGRMPPQELFSASLHITQTNVQLYQEQKARHSCAYTSMR